MITLGAGALGEIAERSWETIAIAAVLWAIAALVMWRALVKAVDRCNAETEEVDEP